MSEDIKLDVDECKFLDNNICTKFKDKVVLCGMMCLSDCNLAEHK